MPEDEAPIALPTQCDQLSTVVTGRESAVEEFSALDVQILHLWIGQQLPPLLTGQLVDADLRERSGALTYR